jgi:hypothetical protein
MALREVCLKTENLTEAPKEYYLAEQVLIISICRSSKSSVISIDLLEF